MHRKLSDRVAPRRSIKTIVEDFQMPRDAVMAQVFEATRFPHFM